MQQSPTDSKAISPISTPESLSKQISLKEKFIDAGFKAIAPLKEKDEEGTLTPPLSSPSPSSKDGLTSSGNSPPSVWNTVGGTPVRRGSFVGTTSALDDAPASAPVNSVNDPLLHHRFLNAQQQHMSAGVPGSGPGDLQPPGLSAVPEGVATNDWNNGNVSWSQNTSSIWTSSVASSSSLMPSYSADNDARQYRSLSIAVGLGEMSSLTENASFNGLKNAIPEDSLETEISQEEYLSILSKSRTRSKSSSAIYGIVDDEHASLIPHGLSADSIDMPVSAPMTPNRQNSISHGVGSSNMRDISSIWRDPAAAAAAVAAGRSPELHRRSSTQPNTLMWEAFRSASLATPEDMNGAHAEEILERFRQQQAQAQLRRFSVAPSMVHRFMSKEAGVLPGMSSTPVRPMGTALTPPHAFDMPGRRRHSVTGSSMDRKLNTKFLSDGLSKMGLNDPVERLDEINDYFENTENRTRAWMEAGRNLQMNQHAMSSATSPTGALSPISGRTGHRWPLYVVEFKAGRTDFFYASDELAGVKIEIGDLAIVEADRGKDLGKVIETNIHSLEDLHLYQATHVDPLVDSHNGPGREVHPKRLYRLAQSEDVALLLSKSQDEAKAMGVCQVKIRQKKLPMEIVDAEYQWDRRKLTFYFVAERRVDFRELVRELFKIYKTRIWMCAVNPLK